MLPLPVAAGAPAFVYIIYVFTFEKQTLNHTHDGVIVSKEKERDLTNSNVISLFENISKRSDRQRDN